MNFHLASAYNEEKKQWDVKVSGEIDIFNSSEFKNKLLDIMKEQQADLVIDATELEYLDSTALGALVAVLKTVKAGGNDITLRNMRSYILKLFKITNLDKVFKIEGVPNE